MYCVVYSDNFKPYYFQVFRFTKSCTLKGTVMPFRYESRAEAQDQADYLNSVGYADEMDELFI